MRPRFRFGTDYKTEAEYRQLKESLYGKYRSSMDLLFLAIITIIILYALLVPKEFPVPEYQVMSMKELYPQALEIALGGEHLVS